MHENLLLCPVSFMIALALDDGAFEARTMSSIENIFSVKVPQSRNSLRLRWKESLLRKPILRREEGTFTSSDQPLQSTRVSYVLGQLGAKVGFEDQLTHYCVRREVANVIDGEYS